MPGFDGTGPRGLGPRTGGGFGRCGPGAGSAPAGNLPGVVYGIGRGGVPWGGGRGRAFGGGRGRGWWRRARSPYPAAAPADEKAFLEDELTYLEQQLAAVKNRLAEVGDETTEG